MNDSGKIVLVDDDQFEEVLVRRTMAKLGLENELVYFNNGSDALEYLKVWASEVFLIISDMNMPGMSGLDLKKNIDKNPKLRQQSIPFIFSSTSANEKEVCAAFDRLVQGYFYKPTTLDEMAEVLDLVVKYWHKCRTPSNCV